MTEDRVRLTDQQSALLDLLRGCAALIVLAGHVWYFVPSPWAFGKAHPWQSLGAIAFFWLSGFLIAYQCLTKRDYGFGEYVIDRFSRIYVLLVPSFILAAAIFGTMSGRREATWDEWVANLLMLHHTPFDRIAAGLPRWPSLLDNAVLWSLAIEWWLYMLFGIVLFIRRAGAVERALMLVLAVPACLVTGYFVLKEYLAIIWFVGAACAFLFVRWREIDVIGVAIAFALSVTAFLVRFDELALGGRLVNMYDLQLTLAMSAAFFFLVLLAGRIPLVSLRRPLFVVGPAIAFLSYALYLTHEPVRSGLMHHLGWRPLTWWQSLIVMGGCILVAAVMALAFERRHLAVRRWLKAGWLGRRLGVAGARS